MNSINNSSQVNLNEIKNEIKKDENLINEKYQNEKNNLQVDSQLETLNQNKYKNILTKFTTNENYEPMVKLINTEIAVNVLLNSAESSYLLHKKYKKINGCLKNERFINLEINQNTDNFTLDLIFPNQNNNYLNLDQTDLYKNKVLKNKNNSNFIFKNTVNLKKSKSEDNLFNLSDKIKLHSSLNNLSFNHLDKQKNNYKSEVIINHCEKIYTNPNSTDNIVKVNSFINEKNKFRNNSDDNKLTFCFVNKDKSAHTDTEINKEKFNQTDEVCKYEISPLCKAGTLNKNDFFKLKRNIKNEHFLKENHKNNVNNSIKIIENRNKKNEKTLTEVNKNFSKMTTLLSPSNKINEQCHQQISNQFNSNKILLSKTKSEDNTMKPLKSLLKKTNSQNQDLSLDKKKRRVKFADTMMVFCDDWPEEIMPQIIALKSPSEFNLVEIASQGYMFEPPAEYKDFLPFDPPPDYRDYTNTNESTDFNFSNLPNHALLKMYENESNSSDHSGNSLDTFSLNNDMFLKLKYNNLNIENDANDLSNLIENDLEEDNVHIDTYKDMILNDNDEMLEEDAIIGVLKEDEILQAIGSQIDSFDKNVLNEELNENKCDFETFKPDLNDSIKLNGQLNNECAPGSIIILNKNGNLNCQPIQIITPENSDITFSNVEEYTLSPNDSLQDLASDSSITSQDTIIMMTNAILTDNSNSTNEVCDNKKEFIKNNHELKKSDSTTSKESDNSDYNNIATENIIKLNSENNKNSFDSFSNKEENNSSCKIDNRLKKSESSTNNKDSSSSDTIKNLQFNFEESNADSRRDSDTIFEDSSLENSFEINNRIENKSISVSEIRKTFEQKFSLNSEENNQYNKVLNKTPSTESDEQKNYTSNETCLQLNDVNLSFQKNDLYQNLQNSSINSQSSSETVFLNENDLFNLNKNWQNESMIVEYTSEPKTLLPSKRTSLNNVNQQNMQQIQLLQPNFLQSINLQAQKLPNQQQQTENSSQLPSQQSVENQNCTVAKNQNNLQANIQPVNPKLVEDKSKIFQTLPIKLAANKVNNKVFPNQQINTNTLSGQNKPQFILIHSYPNNGSFDQNETTLAHLPNQKAIAIKIHHSQIAQQKSESDKSDNLVNNIQGKLISSNSILPSTATIVQSNSILNHGTFIHQALLKSTHKDFSSNFPNPSEIRRRDGLNAFPQVWQEPPKPGSFPISSPLESQVNKNFNQPSNSNKNELESFVQQDIQRIERIKKRYTITEDDEDPTFGFARRPSVKGIKNKASSTTELIKQLQKNQQNSQNKSNIILTTTAQPNQKINIQRTNPQIVLTSHLLTQVKATDKSIPIQVVTRQQPQTVKISTQAIPIIQKDQNSQKHVYLIPNHFVPGFQQRLLQAGATLPRNHNHLAQLQIPKSNQVNTQQQNTNEINKNKTISNQLIIQSANSNQNISRPSSSLGDAIVKDQSKLIDLSNIKQHQIIYHSNKNTNTDKAKTINLQNPVIINATTSANNNAFQYKTLSMPNVALIKSGNQQITLLTTNKDTLLQQIHQHKIQQQVQNQQMQQQQQKILIQNSQSEPKKEFSSPKHSSTNAINGKISVNNNKTNISPLFNSSSTNNSSAINMCNKNIANFDLVKDTTKRLLTNNLSSSASSTRDSKINTPVIASNLKANEDVSKKKFKTVNSKDGVIFYSMNI